MQTEVKPLSPAELVALCCHVSDDKIKDAKGKIADNTTTPVDFTVRITGTVIKGLSTKSVDSLVDATVTLRDFDSVCSLLRLAGFGPKRVRTLLDKVAKLDRPVDDKLTEVFSQAEAAAALKLPKVTATTKGKAGSVNAGGVGVTRV